MVDKLKMIKHFLNKILNWLLKIFKYIFYPLEINDKKIVFINFNGKGYGCNPKYIAEELIRQNIDCELVWLVSKSNTELPSKIKKIKYGSIRAYYEMSTAKIWISNTRNNKFAIKKPNQYYIQTWHGSFPYKKIEAQIEELLDKKYVKEAKLDGKITDIVLCDNSQSKNIYKNYFWYDGEILNVGLPRNDILFQQNPEIKEKVCKHYGIKKDTEIVLYSPTFRNDGNIECISFNYEKVIEALEKKFNKRFVMIIRLHPNMIGAAKKLTFSKKVLNGTMYADNQELMIAASVCISDFSSVGLEMSLTNKPCFLICQDYVDYTTKERELTIDVKKLPCYFSDNEEDLIKNINNFDDKDYQKRCSLYFNKINFIKNDSSSKEVVEIIKKKMKEKGNANDNKNIHILINALILFAFFKPVGLCSIAFFDIIRKICKAISIIIMLIIMQKNIKNKQLKFMLPFILFWLIYIISSILNRSDYFDIINNAITNILMVIYIFTTYKKDKDTLFKSLSILFWIYIIGQLLTMILINFFHVDVFHEEIKRLYFLGEDNYSAFSLLPMLIVQLYISLSKNGYIKKLWIPLLILIDFLYLYVQSYTALGSLILLTALAVYLIVKKNEAKTFSVKNAFWILLAILALIVVFDIQNLFGFILTDVLGKGLTLNSRTIIWDHAINLIKDKLIFGYGELTATQIQNYYLYGASHAHNFILDLLLKTGICGSIFFYTFIYNSFKKINKNKIEVKLLLGGLICFLILAFMDYYVIIQYQYCLIALLYCQRYDEKIEGENNE